MGDRNGRRDKPSSLLATGLRKSVRSQRLGATAQRRLCNEMLMRRDACNSRSESSRRGDFQEDARLLITLLDNSLRGLA